MYQIILGSAPYCRNITRLVGFGVPWGLVYGHQTHWSLVAGGCDTLLVSVSQEFGRSWLTVQYAARGGSELTVKQHAHTTRKHRIESGHWDASVLPIVLHMKRIAQMTKIPMAVFIWTYRSFRELKMYALKQHTILHSLETTRERVWWSKSSEWRWWW